jgi:myxalamid-type polyketide synthase MxaB
MSEEYLAAIRKVQPRGPYRLAGWSTGGSYAYQLAWLLTQQGEPVDLLAFFDVPPPSICAQADLDDYARFLCDIVELANRFTGARMRADYEALRPLDPETQFQTVLREAKRHLVVAPTTSTDRIRRLLDTARSHVEMLQCYHPPAFAQPIELFRPRQPGFLEKRMEGQLEGDLGWSQITSGPVTLHSVQGDHFSMMTGDNVKRIAEILDDWLRRHVA